MIRFVKHMVNLFEVDLKDKTKNEEFYKSLRQLVTILFAVVFGVGLSELGKFQWPNSLGSSDFWVLVTAYTAVVGSWWGYHWGTISGPEETNVLNYLVDCLLLVVYWFLINKRESIAFVLFCYLLMFLFYTLWEWLRSCKEHGPELGNRVKNALRLNLIIFIFMLLLWFGSRILGIRILRNWWVVWPTMLAVVLIYRYCVHVIYRPK